MKVIFFEEFDCACVGIVGDHDAKWEFDSWFGVTALDGEDDLLLAQPNGFILLLNSYVT